MPDPLRVESNERVDLADFQHTTEKALTAFARQPVAELWTAPTDTLRSWIISGFAMDCPSGKQLRVTRGSAILPMKDGATTYYGAVTAEGDATKIVDMSGYAAGSYGVYIRFEFVDGDPANRVFWNSAGNGNEFTQSINTRRKANWGIRIELTSPGSEWLKIGTVNQATLAATVTGITDQRQLYFEGAVDGPYTNLAASTGVAWGGGNDRNADRQQYGVKDLQTFTAAMRSCLEDIKGPGLRKWYDADIGGMNIGFVASPVEDRLAIGDANCYLDHASPGATSTPRLRVDSTDSLVFARNGTVGSRLWSFVINSVNIVQVSSTSFLPGATTTFDLGSTAKRWSQAWANRWYGTENFKVPAAQADLVARHAQNAVVVRGSFDDAGLLGAGDDWNVASWTHVGTGIYDLTLDQAIADTGKCSVLATLNVGFGSATHALFLAGVVIAGGGSIRIRVANTSGTLADLPSGGAVNVLVVGRPSTLP